MTETTAPDSMSSLHWQMAMLQSIDAGLVVIDREYRIKLWNGFMENHSGLRPEDVRDKNLLELFEEIPGQWFTRKVNSVFELNIRAFTTWEQRPFIFKFRNYRPLTGISPFMYQNMTIIPLQSETCTIEHICLIIYDVTDVASNKQQLNTLNEELAILSRTDRLTGLHNRGFWEEELQREHARFSRNGNPSSLVLLDIDHFKHINDNYGHQAGDQVIRTVADCLRRSARKSDICGRYGGEEFGVILPDADLSQAHYFAERLRKNIEQQTIEFGGDLIRCTTSIGVADLKNSYPTHEVWMQHADQALYAAKNEGRNRTHLA